MTEEEWIKEMDKAQLRLTYLENLIKCDDCGKMYHYNYLGENTAFSTLCKDCVVD